MSNEIQQPADDAQPEDESVLALQNLEGEDEKPEVEAHTSTASYFLCGSNAD